MLEAKGLKWVFGPKSRHWLGQILPAASKGKSISLVVVPPVCWGCLRILCFLTPSISKSNKNASCSFHTPNLSDLFFRCPIHLTHSLIPSSSTFKGLCDYTGATRITRDDCLLSSSPTFSFISFATLIPHNISYSPTMGILTWRSLGVCSVTYLTYLFH